MTEFIEAWNAWARSMITTTYRCAGCDVSIHAPTRELAELSLAVGADHSLLCTGKRLVDSNG